jgi:signal transduction histidine kinase
MIDSSANLHKMISQIKKMHANELGKIAMELVPGGVNECIAQVIKTREERSKSKNIQVSFHFEQDLPPIAMDQIAFGNSVITNLITNAIKFSQTNGEIKVTASSVGDEVCISIKDYGVGMP